MTYGLVKLDEQIGIVTELADGDLAQKVLKKNLRSNMSCEVRIIFALSASQKPDTTIIHVLT